MILLATVVLIGTYTVIEILFSRQLFPVKNICLGSAYFFFSFVIVSGALFGMNRYGLRLSYFICFCLGLTMLIVLYCRKYKNLENLKKIERVKYLPRELIILLVIAALFGGNTFEFFGMGQDQGVYQTKAIFLIGSKNDNQIDLRGYYASPDEQYRAEFAEMVVSQRYAGAGFYYFRGNANRGTVMPDEQYSPASGFFHGIPNFPALLSISGKIFGVDKMMHIQTVFFLLAVALIYMTLDINLRLKKLTVLGITILLILSPIVLWTAKASLTEIFLLLIISAFLFLLTSDSKEVSKILWIPVAAFAFFHVSIYTLMPMFVLLFALLMIQKKETGLLISGVLSLVFYMLGFLSMAYSSPQYTFDNYRPLLGMITKTGLDVSQQDLAALVFAVSSIAIILLCMIYYLRKNTLLFERIPKISMLRTIKIITWACLIFITIKWADLSFLEPGEGVRFTHYKGNGLLSALPYLCISAYAFGTGCCRPRYLAVVRPKNMAVKNDHHWPLQNLSATH
jgi:hypothetical protein